MTVFKEEIYYLMDSYRTNKDSYYKKHVIMKLINNWLFFNVSHIMYLKIRLMDRMK